MTLVLIVILFGVKAVLTLFSSFASKTSGLSGDRK